jgi:hypothetical protein
VGISASIAGFHRNFALGFRTGQCIEQWRRRNQGRIVANDRDRQNADPVVVRQCKRASVGRQIQRLHEEIRVLVRLVEPLRCVVMRRVPAQWSLLNVTGFQANVVIGIAPCGRLGHALRIEGMPCGEIGGDGPISVWGTFPDARAPLAYPAGPRLNVQFRGTIPNTEECLLIVYKRLVSE